MNFIIESISFSFPKKPSSINQDSMLGPKIISNGILLAAADGVGSYKGSEKAAQEAIRYLDQLKFHHDIINYDIVFNSILDRIKSLSKNEREYEGASTTLTFCYVVEKGIHIGHIGDCRAYIKRNGRLIQITKDHTQHQYYLDNKVFTRNQLKNVVGKNIITTAISQIVPMQWDCYYIPFSELELDDNTLSIYIMSDGAYTHWEYLPRFSDKTMGSVIKTGSALQRRIERKGAIDDYTYVACKIHIDDSSTT
ncbi:PP2C family protein-serine/threonine phosphatase [Aeromonas veronii]|uniref:PP2C family protein-serine/threonine phosphatase n=1 Tax=Aeromonas veronii TaxID=654 RepID=UPI0013027259|nr:protein phosphatase 2C domain-containing protein [Aeromonas veronii]KAE9633859.1 hypothetical protein GO977_14135 [Aeromonas veronii]